MAEIDITSRRFRLLIGGTDFAGSLVGEILFSPQVDGFSGLVTTTAQINLTRTIFTVASLDPWVNGLWQIGTVVNYEVANAAGVMTRHPQFGHMRIATVPFYQEPTNEETEILQLELICELGFWLEATPRGMCGSLNPRVGLTRAQLISNLLSEASGGQTLHLAGGEPVDMLYYPPSQQNGLVATAGLLALCAPDATGTAAMPCYLWSDGWGRFRLSREPADGDGSPVLSLSNIVEQKRSNPADFARPFTEFKIIAPQVRVNPNVFPKTYLPVEEFSFYPQFNQDILIVGKYQAETFNESTGVRQRWTVYKGTDIRTFANAGGVVTEAVRVVTEIQREDWTYHTIPANWNSCDPSSNPPSSAGFVKTYDRRIWRPPITVLRTDFIFSLTDIASRAGTMRLNFWETIKYTYHVDQWLQKKEWQARSMREFFPVTTENPFFTPSSPTLQDEGVKYAWGRVESWTKTGCEAWTKTDLPYGPGGDPSATLRPEGLSPRNGISSITEEVPPPVDKMPLPYSVCEESLTAKVNTVPRLGGSFVRKRSVSLPFCTNQQQLDGLALNRQRLDYSRGYGRIFKVPLLDWFLRPDFTPIFRVEYTNPAGAIFTFRAEAPFLAINERESLVGFESPLLSSRIANVTSFPWS
jgi:hypothetical protein